MQFQNAIPKCKFQSANSKVQIRRFESSIEILVNHNLKQYGFPNGTQTLNPLAKKRKLEVLDCRAFDLKTPNPEPFDLKTPNPEPFDLKTPNPEPFWQ